ncbi:MAG: AbrB/MazE/SpoVT family DNA-binding domain-containing protein, partial [bacterium]|nr:AbrB/MazE/SpoVT family DNA-binding domain-containing protein [bacterium]
MVGLKVIKVGNSLGVRLPRPVLDRLHLENGDTLILTEAPGGGFRLTPYDPEFERQM